MYINKNTVCHVTVKPQVYNIACLTYWTPTVHNSMALPLAVVGYNPISQYIQIWYIHKQVS